MHGRSRIRKKLVASVAMLFALAIAVGVAMYFSKTSEKTRTWKEFIGELKQVEAILDQMRWEPPPNVDARRWEAACDITYSAVVNVCYTPEHVPVSEMRRLREDIERKVAEPASFETLRWIWHRLAQTGPHGKEYAERVILLFDEVVGSEQSPDARDMNRDKGQEGTDPCDTTSEQTPERTSNSSCLARELRTVGREQTRVARTLFRMELCHAAGRFRKSVRVAEQQERCGRPGTRNPPLLL